MGNCDIFIDPMQSTPPSSASGTVTSVAMTTPAELSVAGSPIVAAGTLAVSWASQAQNLVLASPDGAAGIPSFRAITTNDLPTLNYWGKTGDAGTNPTTDFVGTTDAQDFVIRANNNPILRIWQADNNISLGKDAFAAFTAPAGSQDNIAVGTGAMAKLNAVASNNIAIGEQSLYNLNVASDNNIGIGKETLYSKNGTNGYSIGIGWQALYQENTGSYNIGIGYRAGYALTIPQGNIAIGESAISNGIAATGGYNVAIGYRAMYNITGTYHSVGIGHQSLYNLTTGAYNVAIGHYSGDTLTDGQNNTLIGNEADVSNGSFNNVGTLGYNALGTASNQIRLGDSNITTFFCQGAYAATTANAANMYVDTNGQIMRSTAAVAGGTVTSVGLSLPSELAVSGSPITTAGTLSASWASQNKNLFFASPDGASGTPSFRAITIDDLPAISIKNLSDVLSSMTPADGQVLTYDTTNGWQAETLASSGWGLSGNSILSGDFLGTTNDEDLVFKRQGIEVGVYGRWSLYLGYQAGYSRTGSFQYNTFVGIGAGYSVTTGNSMTFVGFEAGYSHTTQYGATYYGYKAGRASVGYDNTFIGNLAGFYSTGNYNTLLGSEAGFNLVGTSTNYNNLIGYHAGHAITTGSYNIVNGGSAGVTITTGNQNICIGYGSDVDVNTDSNVIAIGHSVSGASNNIVIGNISNNKFICPAIYTPTTSDAANVVVLATGQVLRTTSSKRYKSNIRDLEVDTSKIYNLTPKTFEDKSSNKTYFGLIAEDVAKEIPALVTYEERNDVLKTYRTNKRKKSRKDRLIKRRDNLTNRIVEIGNRTKLSEEEKAEQVAQTQKDISEINEKINAISIDDTVLTEGKALIPDAVKYDKLAVLLLQEIKKLRDRIDILENK